MGRSDAQDLLLTDEGEHPALVTIRSASDDLMVRLRERSANADQTFLEEHEPFFWDAEISSTRFDSHFTHMDKSSLRNYAEDAEAGVPFMNSHRTGGLFKGSAELPLGRSLSGTFRAGQKSGEPTTMATFYTMRGLKLGEVSTDEFINGVRSGIVRDVSVGFIGGRLVCDVCNVDMMRSETCPHLPGMPYETGEGKQKQQMIASAGIFDARLGEVSAVFKGSTPGAMIVKAQRMAEARLLNPASITLLEDKYRILLPGSPRSFTYDANARVTSVAGMQAPVAAKPVEDGEMTSTTDERTDETRALQEQLDRVRASLGLQRGADLLSAITEVCEKLETAEHEVERLTPMAADGESYRNDLVAQVVTEGKRAFGDGFNEEQQRALLKLAPIDTLKSTRDAYKGVADKLFPNARVTADTSAGEEGATEGDDERPAARRNGRRRYSV